MEFILEFLLELLVEGVTILVGKKKISKWVRYPLWAIIVLLFIFVIGLLFFLGIVLLPKNIGFSILFFNREFISCYEYKKNEKLLFKKENIKKL